MMIINLFSSKKLTYPGNTLLFLFLLLIISNCNNDVFNYDEHYCKGMNIFFQKSTRNLYKPDEYKNDLQQMRSLEINTVFLIPIHYCRDEFSDTIKTITETIEDSVLEEIIKSTLNSGLQVIIKPHVDLENGKPRYQLQPGNIHKWIGCYQQIIRRYAIISSKYSLSHLVIGTEIDRIADSPDFPSVVPPAAYTLKLQKMCRSELLTGENYILTV